MTQEEGKPYPDGVRATPVSELAATSPVSRRDPLCGDGAWGPLDSRKQTGIGRYLLFPKNASYQPFMLAVSV